MRLVISRLLFIGMLISFILIVTGGLLYLSQHSNDLVDYQHVHKQAILLSSLTTVLSGAIALSPISIIQLGLVVLFFIQILRIILMAWFFAKEKSLLFCGMSLFILFIILTTPFWHV